VANAASSEREPDTSVADVDMACACACAPATTRAAPAAAQPRACRAGTGQAHSPADQRRRPPSAARGAILGRNTSGTRAAARAAAASHAAAVRSARGALRAARCAQSRAREKGGGGVEGNEVAFRRRGASTSICAAARSCGAHWRCACVRCTGCRMLVRSLVQSAEAANGRTHAAWTHARRVLRRAAAQETGDGAAFPVPLRCLLAKPQQGAQQGSVRP
jgi:hypothetical protein